MIHLDTSYLIDLLRETRRRDEGPARKRLQGLADVELRVSVHAMCELFAGVELSSRRAEERRVVAALTAGFEVAYPGVGFAPTYARLLAPLHRTGSLVSTIDLLIATAAVVDEAPILTANPKHFDRIGELEVLTY